jgi:hypothetical protein
MRIDAESKGNPNLENVHKVIAHAGSCFSLDFDPSGRFVHQNIWCSLCIIDDVSI